MGKDRIAEPPSAERARQLRELMELERQSAALRTALGMTRAVEPLHVARATEDALHALIGRRASDFISVHAADGTYLWASPSCRRLFGWEPAGLIGRSAYELFHPDDLQRIQENHGQHVDQASAAPVEYRLRTADGSYRWVCTHSSNSKDQHGLPQIVCVTRDISAKREREEQVATLLAHQQQPSAQADADLLCVCAWCKGVRDEAGRWNRIEDFLSQLLHRELTHGICGDCLEATREEILELERID